MQVGLGAARGASACRSEVVARDPRGRQLSTSSLCALTAGKTFEGQRTGERKNMHAAKPKLQAASRELPPVYTCMVLCPNGRGSFK